MLALPRRSGDSQLLTRAPDERFIWSTAPSDSYSGAIKQVIRAYAGDGWLTVNETSEVVGTSVRTMQCRLSAENKTYSDILEETRAELAGNLLENTDATMFEISKQLGYSDQATSHGPFVAGQRCRQRISALDGDWLKRCEGAIVCEGGQ